LAQFRKSFPEFRDGDFETARHPLLASLSPAIHDRLRIYEALLRKWQPSINLVSRRTLDELWIRHFADSLQVPAAIPGACHWLDLGSGAGFPGLVTAILHADDRNAKVHLVESDRRKCAFLREVSRETGAPTVIHCDRIENIVPKLTDPIEAVSARALAPLDTLLLYAEPILAKGAVCVFSKGKQLNTELTQAKEAGKYLIMTVPSQTDPASQLVIVRRK
jgi:16S rRNA (guanine527-N7)-methyltransferase